MSRMKSREYCFKILYQIDIHKGSRDEVLEIFFEENAVSDEDKRYINKVVFGALEEFDNINSLIESKSKEWKIGRISKVTLAILRVAIFEMLKMDDIPISVSINEAIDMAKEYDNKKTGAFVNGILGAIQKQIDVGACDGENDSLSK